MDGRTVGLYRSFVMLHGRRGTCKDRENIVGVNGRKTCWNAVMAGRQKDRLSRSLDILHRWAGRVDRLTTRLSRSLGILHGWAGRMDGRTDRLYRSSDNLHGLAERVDGWMDRLCNSASRYYVPEREIGDRGRTRVGATDNAPKTHPGTKAGKAEVSDKAGTDFFR